MPDLIQRIPQGLLGFYAIKGGALPNFLGNELQPDLELLKWYTQTASEVVTDPVAPITVVAGVQQFNIVVPEREYWLLHQFSLFYAMGALDEATVVQPLVVGPATDNAQGTTAFALGPTGFGVFADQSAFVSADRGLGDFYGPGAGFAANHAGVTGTFTVTPIVWITRLPI